MKDNQNNLPIAADRGHNDKNYKDGQIAVTFWLPAAVKDGFYDYCETRGLIKTFIVTKLLAAAASGELDDLIYTPSAFKKPSVGEFYEMKKTRRIP